MLICFSFTEYDPNPLLSLSKRRRRASTSVSTEERRLSVPAPSPMEQEVKAKELASVRETTEAEQVDPELYRERKRLKKRKREKKLHEDKKKKKKHKCVETQCKHKKHHKKHKKHKKHHHSKEIVEETVEITDEVLNGVEEEEENCTEINEPEECQIVANPEDEVTMDDIIESRNKTKVKW